MPADYYSPSKCSIIVSASLMDWFDDIQVEEMKNFDFVSEDIEDLVQKQKDFNMKEYLNGNIDY